MATVVLANEVWLNDARNPADRMAFGYLGDSYSVTTHRGGGVERGYGSGRSRSWTSPERTTSVQATLHATTPEQRAWLIDHQGVTVCLRDPTGLKVFGVYFSTPLSLSTLPLGHRLADNAAQFSLESVTFSESA